ncbi:MAG: hypothetical protein ACOX4M_07115 [Acetivibrionales bacterium]|jgi:hypothetical protein
MKKIILPAILLSMLLAGCSIKAAIGGNNGEKPDAPLPVTGGSVAKTQEGEIKFYPTYDDRYKTGNNEYFDFWFDIPVDWKAVDKSEDGSVYDILPGNDKVEIKISGVMKDGPEEEFYDSLAGSRGKVSGFVYRDGWVGKQVEVSESESYFVRVDGDSYIVLYINAAKDPEWKKRNEEKLNYVAQSVRITRESYGKGFNSENAITLDDLQLGNIRVDMSYEEFLQVMGQEPEHEIVDEYEGLQARTLFFKDNTQVYIVDNVVYTINVTSPEYATPRGLKTGDGEERLLELYGEPSGKEDGIWGYCYNGYELLTFVVSEGKVVEIQADVGM